MRTSRIDWSKSTALIKGLNVIGLSTTLMFGSAFARKSHAEKSTRQNVMRPFAGERCEIPLVDRPRILVADGVLNLDPATRAEVMTAIATAFLPYWALIEEMRSPPPEARASLEFVLWRLSTTTDLSSSFVGSIEFDDGRQKHSTPITLVLTHGNPPMRVRIIHHFFDAREPFDRASTADFTPSYL